MRTVRSAALALLLAGCALGPLGPRPESFALPQSATAATRIGTVVAPAVAAHPGSSGIIGLQDPYDAFAARILLVEAAERTLDVQYYIWHRDDTGILMLDALRRAAERGVRVRLLLDDLGTSGLDRELAAIDGHPNVEVRLFNPFASRRAKWTGFVTAPGRANRRMHNKSFTADNQASIVGGRNIGDPYFNNTDDLLFTDLDVLAVGDVVADISTDFDRYWASRSAYPLAQVMRPAPTGALAALEAAAARIAADSGTRRFSAAVTRSTFMQALLANQPRYVWAPTRLVSDDPAKGLRDVPAHRTTTSQMLEAVGDPQRRLSLISPYFVPTRGGVEGLAALERRGVSVRVLTNSLDATDVAMVHAGYAKRRKALLAAGVELSELRRLSEDERARRRAAPPDAPIGAGATLHVKAVAVDGERIFVGSYNFDPRSALLNTEMGLVIESPLLAEALDRVFEAELREYAYVVQQAPSGRVVWMEYRDGRWIVHEQEPRASGWRRLQARLLAPLPIDWLL